MLNIIINIITKWSFLLSEDENLVFRGNSFATKSMDSYMKMIGESVSQESFVVFLTPFLCAVESDHS